LTALKDHPDVFLYPYDKEIKTSESGWRELLDGNGKCIFGLFDNTQMVGFAAVLTWQNDPSGQSGLMAMDYIDAKYRGRHLSKLLYEARINWAINHTPFKRLVISHKEGNEASRRANQAFGFKFIGNKLIEWPDGSKAPDHTYELDIESLRRSLPTKEPNRNVRSDFDLK
jgi:RimJ/RimL family protein N-acetyltransferase